VPRIRARLGPTILGQPTPDPESGFDASAFDSATFDKPSVPQKGQDGRDGGVILVDGSIVYPATSDNSPNASVSQVAPFEARVQTSTRGRVSVEANAKTGKARPRARTKVGRSVLKNAAEIELIGASFIALIDSRIEELQQKRPNSDEGKAAIESEIAGCDDLRGRVEAFLGAAARFSTEKAKEKVVVSATTSFAEGIGNWWSKNHVRICDQTFQLGYLESVSQSALWPVLMVFCRPLSLAQWWVVNQSQT
jgi:hypothetical protein